VSGSEKVAGILLAAGASSRMGTDKLWADLGGKPLISWPLQVLAASNAIDELVIAVSASARHSMSRLLEDLSIVGKIVLGGARRQDSVRAALDAVSDADWVVVHDGARPFLTEKLILDGLRAARGTGAAVAAVPVIDTIKRAEEGTVLQTLERDGLWAVQTPQVFRRALLAQAHAASSLDVTDDAALVEGLGAAVRVYMGAPENIKVTTPSDLLVAGVLLETRV
jgi:2-C-methyl-D-erythritol 4-phosphate cytidylyltransferase